MKERPILFSGPMVRAILDGRKTQTRRVVKQDREGLLDCEPHPAWDAFWQCVACPYGKPGDRIDVIAAVDVGKGMAQHREVKTLMQDVTILAMASLAEARDADTNNHLRRIQHYARALAWKTWLDSSPIVAF